MAMLSCARASEVSLSVKDFLVCPARFRGMHRSQGSTSALCVVHVPTRSWGGAVAPFWCWGTWLAPGGGALSPFKPHHSDGALSS